MSATPSFIVGENATKPPASLRALDQGALAFIVGCGRSGTTILGQLIEQHPGVRYFNDRFDLWLKPFPIADIWSYRERYGAEVSESGRVALDAQDAMKVEPFSRQAFLDGIEREREAKPIVVEKLAINNFRIGFLRALLPRSPLIAIMRHGVEVASSIAQRAEAGRWYGKDDRKWSMLEEHARTVGLGHLLPLCTGLYERGLLEWRMSVEAAEPELARWPRELLCRVRYEDLMADPEPIVDRSTDVLGLEASERMKSFARREIARRTPAAKDRAVPASTEAIAGETLRRFGYEW